MRNDATCGCGCDEQPKSGNSFVHGHNARRSPEPYIVDERGCWVWQRSRMGHGYGRLKRGGIWLSAHRYYYELLVGPIPAGLTIDHLCRNRACVNPDHMEPVTLAENQRRAGLRKLTDEQRYAIAASDRPAPELAALYGIAVSTVYGIRSAHRPPMKGRNAA